MPNCESPKCPRCGQTTPAVSNVSDGRDAFRCDRCGLQWTLPTATAGTDEELPPVPAIDATGG
jgi:transposase-like protein